MSRRRNRSETEERPAFTKENMREALKIFQFIRPYRMTFIIGMILLFISSMVFTIFPYLSGQMVDIAQGNSEMPYTLNDIGIVLLVVLLAQSFVSYHRVLLFAKLSEKSTADVRKALYDKLITLPSSFFEKNKSGELISRLTADVEKLYNTFSITLAEFARQVIILIAGIVFLAFTAWKLALIMLATFPVVIIGAMIFGRYIRRLSKQRQEELAATNDILSETIQGIQVVKAFTSEVLESIRYGKSIDKVVVTALTYARGRAIFSLFIIFFLFGALFFIIWQGAKFVENGTMSAGELIGFVVYTAIIGGAIAGLGNFFTEIIGAIGATERVREILEQPGEVAVTPSDASQRLALEGAIIYENVDFTYPSRPDIQILKNLNLSIKAGEKVALVGASGAGKSTIVQLLLKFYHIQSGDIKVDGKSIYDMNTTALREHIAFVPQEVILFGGTIRENILYGKPNATDAEIKTAAQKANAWEFISTFPEALDTIVGERGVKLSGGQRQRIAIARAILKDPAILLLDEATSALDAESEKLVQEALNSLMEGRTSIIIAHRLATIREVDRIYVLEEGNIIEQGTHETLSLLEDGAYNALARLQFDAGLTT